ncbi:MAG: fibronectin type III domain-containing protein [Eubacterium sp.]
MKRLLTMIFAVIISITAILPAGEITAQALDYASQLRSKGFPESYIDALVELHEKYPKWIFEPLFTGIDWQTAVNGERSSHSNQLIEKISSYDTSMFCNCSKCYSNGSYIIQEASNWVSASEKAVKYYMDPRNWLDEQYIFQFESTKYDGTQTKAGVEAILDGTWMHDSLITYKTTSGSTKTYDSSTKYSDVIMKAANDSGMSAYYLASKIRQENGGASATASAVSGTVSPFQGIYNYYNIGAYTGAKDGLSWAAGYLKANNNTTLYSSYNSQTGKGTGTKTQISSGQYMTWRANMGNYYYVRLYNESGGYTEGKSGYVLVSDCRTTYLGDTSTGWGRPWTNPYKSIYYGAKYISKNFSTQTSGYLQKFNVSPTSDYLYTHEYMANVAAAVAESVTTYNAYSKAGILSITKKFSIPVFENMPNEKSESLTLSKVSGLKVTSYTNSSVSLSWSKVANAQSYQVQVYKSGKWVNYTTTSSTKATVSGLISCGLYRFRVRACANLNSKTIYGAYSSLLRQITKAAKVKNFKGSSTNTSITLTWSKVSRATGYRIYKYDSKTKTYKKYKDVTGTSLKISGLSGNTTYKFKIAAYRTAAGKTVVGTLSSALSVKTKNKQVTLKSAKSNSTKRITVKWNKMSGVTGYEVMWSTSSTFKSNFLSTFVKGSSKTSTTLKTAQSKKTYYVRVRAYKTVNGKKQYYTWSKTIKLKTK